LKAFNGMCLAPRSLIGAENLDNAQILAGLEAAGPEMNWEFSSAVTGISP